MHATLKDSALRPKEFHKKFYMSWVRVFDEHSSRELGFSSFEYIGLEQRVTIDGNNQIIAKEEYEVYNKAWNGRSFPKNKFSSLVADVQPSRFLPNYLMSHHFTTTNPVKWSFSSLSITSSLQFPCLVRLDA